MVSRVNDAGTSFNLSAGLQFTFPSRPACASQIIHPARYWGIFKEWDGQSPLPVDSIPWLYRDFDDASAEALEGLDCELQVRGTADGLSQEPLSEERRGG